MGAFLSDLTFQCWTAFTHHLINFNSTVSFDYFNETGINKFVVYLRNKCGLEEKSVQKQFNNLRGFLYWAIRKGYCHELTIKSYRPKFKVLEKPVIFLTKEELLHLDTSRRLSIDVDIVCPPGTDIREFLGQYGSEYGFTEAKEIERNSRTDKGGQGFSFF